MCQPGSAPLAKRATPQNRAPDKSATTTATPSLDKVSLPDFRGKHIEGGSGKALPPASAPRGAASTPPTQRPATPVRPAQTAPSRPAAAPVAQPTPAPLPASATIDQQLNHLFKVELPPILMDAMKKHHTAFNDKAKKEIVAGSTLVVMQKMSALAPLCESLRAEIRRDPTNIDSQALSDGQFRARCCQAIKVILDKYQFPKDGRPLFLR
jgi:hypothetical protein